MKGAFKILSLLILISCSTRQKSTPSKTDWCQDGIDKASHKIEAEGLIYTKYTTMFGGFDDYDKELEQLLVKAGLSFKYEALSCLLIDGEDEERDCYEKTMLQAIEDKYGLGFIQELEEQAHTLFSIREKNTYSYSNLDKPLQFVESNGDLFNVDEIGTYINRNVPYLKKLKSKNPAKKTPIISIDFLIDETGNLFDLNIYGEWFAIEGLKHQVYFEEDIRKMTSKIDNWGQGKVNEKPVYYNYKLKIAIGK